MPPRLIVSLPDDKLVAELERIAPPLPEGAVEFVRWDLTGPPPAPHLDIVVPGYMGPGLSRLGALDGVSVRLVQGQSIGYDGVAAILPAGIAFANASTVHETATAELAMGLLLASQRGIDVFARNAERGDWAPRRLRSLADRTVLLLGYGGVNKAIEARLAPFELGRVIRVASRARDLGNGYVHGIDELATLLPEAEVVVIATPLTDATRGLIGAAELALLPDDAVVVNVARGAVVDMAAVLAEAGRLRFALDVTDPEPLPEDHPLWTAPGVLISPHIGGAASAMEPRMARLLRRQIDHLLAGEAPENVVLGA
jgi:phosphoglycerate dehydrogenase-like enzyme